MLATSPRTFGASSIDIVNANTHKKRSASCASQ